MQYTAIYVRVSTEEQAKKGYSIESQKVKLESYCRERGWAYAVYEDSGFSAGSLNRPSIQLLINEIKAGKINKVVVWKLDRLSRRMRDLYNVLALFEKHDVELVSVTENIITNSSLGKFLTGILGSVAELEREQIRERIRAVKDTRKRVKRLPLGQPPLGYGAGFKVVPEQAEVVREIFGLAQFMGTTGIARSLNKKGLRTRDGNTWSRVAVHRILTNETYAGIIRLEEGGIIRGNYEAIISVDLFKKTNERLRKRAGRKSSVSKHLLSGIMVCGLCGKTMGATGDYKAGKRFYTCVTKISYDSRACPNRRFKADLVESSIKKMIAGYAGKERYKVFEKVEEKIRESGIETLRKRKAEVEQALLGIERRISKLYELFEEERVDRDILLERIDRLRKRKENLQEKIAELEEEIRENDPQKVIRLLKEAFNRFEELWDVSSPADRKALLATMINSITAYPDKIIVDLRWGEKRVIPYERQKKLIDLTDSEREAVKNNEGIHSRIVQLADEGLMGKEISSRIGIDYSKVIWVLRQFRKGRLAYLRRAKKLRGPQVIPEEARRVLEENRDTLRQLLTPRELMRFLETKGVTITYNLAKNIIYQSDN